MNYSEVKTAVLAYSDRSDTETSDNFDTFLEMFESRINRYLKTREMSVRATHAAVTDQDYYSLPSDYAGIRDIEVYTAGSSTRETLLRLTPEQMNALDDDDEGIYYTIIADQFQIKPVDNIDGKIIEIIYYQKVPALTSTATTNWLATNYPDCYVTGVMVELSSYMKDLEAVGLWQQRYAEVISEIEQNDHREQWSGTPMAMRIV